MTKKKTSNNKKQTQVAKWSKSNLLENSKPKRVSKPLIIRDEIDIKSMSPEKIIEKFLCRLPETIPLIKIKDCQHPIQFSNLNEYINSMSVYLTEEFKVKIFELVESLSISWDKCEMSNLNSIKMNNSINYYGSGSSFSISFKELTDEIKDQDLILFKILNSYDDRPMFIIGRAENVGVPIKYDKSNIYKQVIHCKFSKSVSNTPIIYQIQELNQIEYLKISNCLLFIREMNALKEIKKSFLLQTILTPSNLNYRSIKSMVIPSVLKSHLLNSLNKSQIKAINESLCENGITLIQGPPGTGKTHTICSLLSVLLSIDPNYKILVCAPSNSAVDQVAERVLDKGLLNGFAKSYNPNIVRIGNDAKVSIDLHHILNPSNDIIKQCSIAFSTLSASVSVKLKFNFKPDIVIVDESTQSVESSTIIPLSYSGAKKLILVGDTLQLPPTIISKENELNGYNLSLFERLSLNGVPMVMLNTQYRMNPIISKFPSSKFYNWQLIDGNNVLDPKYSMKFQKDKNYGTLSLFNIHDSKEDSSSVSSNSKSIKNDLEIQVIFTLIKKLVQDYPECKKCSFGIITPYKLQRLKIEEFNQSLNWKLDITCNTIDGFQGSEKDIIFFSCVRSNEKSIGFLSDTKRINVGITRAKHGLFIVGKKLALRKDKTWGPYIKYIESIGGVKSFDLQKIDSLKKEIIKFDSNINIKSKSIFKKKTINQISIPPSILSPPSSLKPLLSSGSGSGIYRNYSQDYQYDYDLQIPAPKRITDSNSISQENKPVSTILNNANNIGNYDYPCGVSYKSLQSTLTPKPQLETLSFFQSIIKFFGY